MIILRKFTHVFLLLLFITAVPAFGQIDPVAFIRGKWKEYKMAGNDSVKIERLFDLAFFQFDYMGDDRLADSVSQLAIQIAEVSHRPELLGLAYHRYIGSNNLSGNYKKALGYALKAEQFSANSDHPMTFRNYKNLVTVYLSGFDYDKALEYSYKLLSVAGTSDNSLWQAEGYLDIGKSLDGKNQKIEAFRNYLNAIRIAERARNADLLADCYAAISRFYNMNRLYNKATHYKLLQLDLQKKKTPVDSAALMWIKYDLQVIDLNSNNNRLNEKSMQDILDFAARWNYRRLRDYEITLIRTHLIEADKINQLHDLYHLKFPRELERLSVENPGLFYRITALLCEYEQKTDSALFYFNKAETVLQADPNKILQSNFYNRFGQFLLRHGMKEEAIDKFSRSYELAKSASYFTFMIGASKELESLYAGKGDYKNAYNYSVLNKVLSDSLDNMSKSDQMLIMEIDHETRLRDQAAEQEKQSTIRRHYLQYSAMIIIIIGVFIVLLMLGSLKVPEWIIKMLGFFSFIFLFEFIILLADHKIHGITHGEPWKILLIKIFLIAILLPVHHWIEKRVVAFLLNPGLVNISRYPLKSRIREFAKNKTGKR